MMMKQPRAIEQRLARLEALIPPRVKFSQLTDRVAEATRRGVSPAKAWLAILEDLSVRQLELLLDELEGGVRVRPEDDETPESIRSCAIALGFSPADVDLF